MKNPADDILQIDIGQQTFNSSVRGEAYIIVVLKNQAKQEARRKWYMFRSWKFHYARYLKEVDKQVDRIYEHAEKYV